MKKSLSYALPAAALIILVLLAFRWLSNRPGPGGAISDTAQSAEGIEINDLTNDTQRPTGIADMESVKLNTPANATASAAPVQGEVRYAPMADDSTRFNVSADLPELKAGSEFYQLWVEGEKGRKKAMKLSLGKAGYIAEGALSSEFDQVKVIISKERVDDEQIEDVQLEGTINLKKAE